jgi:hypothetical protein
MVAMSLVFEPINLSRQTDYFNFFDKCPVKTSDYSFTNLWSWADTYGLKWAWGSDLVWIKQTQPREAYWAPVGDWNRVDWNAACSVCPEEDVSFIRIPETLAMVLKEMLKDRISIDPVRAQWDYLYSVDELKRLSGNRFHKKKNLVNQFKKKYDFEYVSLTDELTGQAAGMQENWCTWRDCESNEALDAENAAILKVLSNWQRLERITGGALTVHGEMVAYTVAEHLTDDTLLIHFEKGNPEYKGVYQAINQLFLQQKGNDFQFVNREQDLGDEGLRKAKLSYLPIDFLKKFSVKVSGDTNQPFEE